jgi:HEXXH motif-containing protein
MPSAIEVAALSCPGERSVRGAIVARLRANLQRVYVRGLLARSGETLAREAPELAASLERAREDVLFAKTIPCQQAALVAAVRGDENDAVWVAAQVGLALRHAGAQDPWSVRFATRRRVRFGAWVSPPVERIDSAALDNLGARGWTRLPELAVGSRSVAVVPEELREVCPIEVASWKASDEIPACTADFSESLELVSRAAPAYIDWIGDALHTIVPVDSPAGATTSKSFNNVDGVVMIGLPADCAELGELLVHEASHGLLHLVEPVTALSNLCDDRRYHSPFARADRDIRRILVGFHAFANIAAYYQRLGGPAANEWLARWFPALETCHRVLVASPGLTAHGRALFEPVASRIGL